MPDILIDVPIRAPIDRVFDAISTPAGMDVWWTSTCAGGGEIGAEFRLGFGPQFDWAARVTKLERPSVFQLEMVRSDDDWAQTRVRFELRADRDLTWLQFAHEGWKSANEHFRISAGCWAMYLRVLRRNLEHGETVPYEQRLEV